MSKKAVIELSKEELELLDTLLWRGIDESSSDYWDDGAKLMTNIEEQAKKNRSIIEWHPVSEKPKIGSQIIVRFASGMSKLDIYGKILEGNMLDQFDQSSIVEWAYLPE
jgi:hypothetical protein